MATQLDFSGNTPQIATEVMAKAFGAIETWATHVLPENTTISICLETNSVRFELHCDNELFGAGPRGTETPEECFKRLVYQANDWQNDNEIRQSF